MDSRLRRRAAAGHYLIRMSGWNDASDEEGRAPICPYCGVTTLPAELSHVIDTDFVCDNEDCEAYGDRIDP